MLTYSESNFLPSIQENDFLPPIGRWATVGGLFIICVSGLAIPVASVAKYKETVKAEAIIRPAGELRIVQAATTGQVMDILVKGNQVVKQGDVIATIDDSKLQTKKSQLQTSIQQAHLQLVQINALLSAIDRQIKAETDRNNRSITVAVSELSRRRRDYQDKRMTTIAEVKEAEANFKSAVAALNAARAKRDRYQPIAKDGALSKDQLQQAQLEVQQQQQAVEVTRAKVQRAVAALNPSNAEVAIASEQIAQAKAAAEANKANLDKDRLALIRQRIEIQKQLNQDTRELQQVAIEFSQTVITATADGIVSKLNLRNPGQTVSIGEQIAEIVPSDASLEIKAAVAIEDKSKLKLGQDVQMRVSACPYPDYGTLKGKVSQISVDTIKPQQNSATATDSTTASSRNPNAATAFYEVTIKPESLALGQGKNQCGLQLGMDGRADIISREETVLQFLLRKGKLILDP